MRRIVWSGVLLAVLAAGCSDDGANTAPAGRADRLRDELETRGHVVAPLGSSDGWSSVGTEWWCASDIVVGVHEYSDDDAMERDVARLLDPGFASVTDFAAPPHFYAHDRVIVEAVGAHDALVPTLIDLFGPALAVHAFGFEPSLSCDEFTS